MGLVKECSHVGCGGRLMNMLSSWDGWMTVSWVGGRSSDRRKPIQDDLNPLNSSELRRLMMEIAVQLKWLERAKQAVQTESFGPCLTSVWGKCRGCGGREPRLLQTRHTATSNLILPPPFPLHLQRTL
jgi:hypothetical protein